MPASSLSLLITSLMLYAGYDSTFDATMSRGSGHAVVEIDKYAPVISRGNKGRFGEAAVFRYGDKQDSIWTKDVIRYAAEGNFPRHDGVVGDGAIGMWLKIDIDDLMERSLIWLDPVHLLGPGNTDRGKIWMDFVTKELPGAPIFRFGATLPRDARSDPGNSGEGHVVVIPDIAFSGNEWHHIVGTWMGMDGAEGNGSIRLYFDGRMVGEIAGFTHRLSWDMKTVEIRVGLGFKGMIDEFFIMDRFLTDSDVELLHRSERPLEEYLQDNR